jgi:hypothetical protein
MIRLPFALFVLIGLTGVASLSGHAAAPKKKPDSVEALMKKKLIQAQKILEGITVQDFDKISKPAEELIEISNDVKWKVFRTPTYERYSKDFRATAEELAQHGKKKKLDAAALSYVELTLICVKCHKHVRDKRDASLELPLRYRAAATETKKLSGRLE